MIRILGAVMILFGCMGVGLAMCRNHRRKAQMLQELENALRWMSSQLQYQMLPLSALCGSTAEQCKSLGPFFRDLAMEFEGQTMPQAADCVGAALNRCADLPAEIKSLLLRLGQGMGQLDLQGQQRAFEYIAELCRGEWNSLTQNQQQRLRSYRILGICAGTALVILFL